MKLRLSAATYYTCRGHVAARTRHGKKRQSAAPVRGGKGRYQEAGESVTESVLRKPAEGPPDTTSTPVTRRDYESLEKPATKRSES
jgi:hypothetical protein